MKNDVIEVARRQFEVITYMKNNVAKWFLLFAIIPLLAGVICLKSGVVIAGIILLVIGGFNWMFLGSLNRVLSQEKYENFDNYLWYIWQKAMSK